MPFFKIYYLRFLRTQTIARVDYSMRAKVKSLHKFIYTTT